VTRWQKVEMEQGIENEGSSVRLVVRLYGCTLYECKEVLWRLRLRRRRRLAVPSRLVRLARCEKCEIVCIKLLHSVGS
jgi:hypothetical protein